MCHDSFIIYFDLYKSTMEDWEIYDELDNIYKPDDANHIGDPSNTKIVLKLDWVPLVLAVPIVITCYLLTVRYYSENNAINNILLSR